MSRVAECLTSSERVVIKSFLNAASSTHADENEDEIKEWHAGEVSSILTSTKRSNGGMSCHGAVHECTTEADGGSREICAASPPTAGAIK